MRGVSPPQWTCGHEEPGFPPCLLDLPDPPKRIFGIGDRGLLRPGLAIVGSRCASPYGLTCTRRFASAAARLGIVVVSGGATGCDSMAHQATLDAGGRTVAVLGCGADVDYPQTESRTLARVRESGVVISELPFGHQPRRWAFPRRNRIIAGLSHAVLVVEAGLPSGTFSTADQALDAGRSVLAVPGSIYSHGSAGTNRLVRDGAIPITCEEDLVQAMSDLLSLGRDDTADPADTGYTSQEPIVEALLSRALTPEELASALGMSVRLTLTELSRLETSGLVTRGPAGTFTPSSGAYDARS